MCCTRLAKKYRTQKLAICAPSHKFIGLYLRNFVSDTAVFVLKRDVKLQPTNLLQQRRSTEVHQTLQNVWPSAGLVYYIYIFGGSCPLSQFCQVQNSLYVQVLRSPVLAALLHGAGAVGVSQTLWHGSRNGIMELLLLIIFNRGRHLYSESGHDVGIGLSFYLFVFC